MHVCLLHGRCFSRLLSMKKYPKDIMFSSNVRKETETPADIRDLALIHCDSAVVSSVRNWM